nr:hypothetical protein [Moraxella osloensis]
MNNPFFQQMRAISVADVLRVVDQIPDSLTTSSMCWHESKSRQYEVDLLAILIANATIRASMASLRSPIGLYQLSTIQANYFAGNLMRPMTVSTTLPHDEHLQA